MESANSAPRSADGVGRSNGWRLPKLAPEAANLRPASGTRRYQQRPFQAQSFDMWWHSLASARLEIEPLWTKSFCHCDNRMRRERLQERRG
jgi:hypothetical protein